MAARLWTPEQRQRQREAISRWKPWEQSSGPKTAEGKANVSRNGWKGGMRRLLRELARVLKEQRESWLD
jgi:hypothetical protein